MAHFGDVWIPLLVVVTRGWVHEIRPQGMGPSAGPVPIPIWEPWQLRLIPRGSLLSMGPGHSVPTAQRLSAARVECLTCHRGDEATIPPGRSCCPLPAADPQDWETWWGIGDWAPPSFGYGNHHLCDGRAVNLHIDLLLDSIVIDIYFFYSLLLFSLSLSIFCKFMMQPLWGRCVCVTWFHVWRVLSYSHFFLFTQNGPRTKKN